jgi:hypothetical protein
MDQPCGQDQDEIYEIRGPKIRKGLICDW